MSARKSKVEHSLRDVLSQLLRDVRDPRVRRAQLITVTRVELNVDLSVAMVYLSIVGTPAQIEGAVAGLRHAAGFLRGPAGRAANLSRPPELRFVHDDSAAVSARLSEIVREDEARARAAAGDAGDSDDGSAPPRDEGR